MKQSKVHLNYIPDIIEIYMITYNLCIVNNKMIKDEWFVEAKNELARGVSEGEIREGNELLGRKTRLFEMKRNILAR